MKNEKRKMIKYSTLLILISLFSATLFAQTPQAFKYQAIARDESGNILSGWDIALRVSILQDNEAGLEVYTETHQVKSSIYGLINLVIGEGRMEKGEISDINWGESSHFIKIEMDTNGGSDYKQIGASQLYAVPYALYAEKAGKIADYRNSSTSSKAISQKPTAKSHGNNRNGNPNTKFSGEDNSFMNANIGNAGIGTTEPDQKLDVKGNIKANQMILVDANGNQWQVSIDTTGAIQVKDKFFCGDSINDPRDGGRWYQTVLIGIQCWMAENLNVGTRVDGSGNQDDDDIIEKYCYYDEEDSCNVYGGLYQYMEAMNYDTIVSNRGICPEGWHIPTYEDWEELIDSLGGANVAGGKMKESGNTHWSPPNTDGFNSSGFTGLPGGWRNFGTHLFENQGGAAYFWSEQRYSSVFAYYRKLSTVSAALSTWYVSYSYGFSVRCILNKEPY